MSDPGCFFHGVEPITAEHTTICGECGHAFTTDELIAEDLRVRLEIQCADGPSADLYPQPVDQIFVCPLCSHDF